MRERHEGLWEDEVGRIYHHRQCLIAALAIAVLALSSMALAPKALAEPKVLDNAGLEQMLVNLGYEPAEHKFSNGNTYYTIRVVSGGNWGVDVSGGGSEFVWVSLDFRQLKDDQNFPREVLLEALETNFGMNYMRFLHLPNERRLRLAGSIPNRDVTPADLRKMIDEGIVTSQQTQHLWNPDEWRVQPVEE